MLCFKVTFVKSLSVHIILHHCRSAIMTDTVTWDNERRQICLNPHHATSPVPSEHTTGFRFLLHRF